MLNKILRVGLLVSVLAIMAIAGSGLVLVVFASPEMGSPLDGGWGWNCWHYDSYFTVGTIFTTINAALSAVLLTSYVANYRRTRAEFNLILIIVAVTLLCYSFVANPLVSTALGYEASGLGPFCMLPNLFTLVALSALLYLSLRY